jgi:VIT1/CCC1 family predicted Fe2+/Mn2+ transporter
VGNRQRILDPIARVSEILFGLIMALTFTTTLNATTAGREDVRTLLVGAIGCNIAWGLVDAVMFIVSALAERGNGLMTIRAVRAAAQPGEAHRVISEALPPVLASILTSDDFDRLRQRLVAVPEPARPTIATEDWLGALAVFLLVFISTFPVVIPFLLFAEVAVSIRVSNAVAIAMMFLAGFVLARHGGYNPWRVGASMVVLGVLLVAIAIALGG